MTAPSPTSRAGSRDGAQQGWRRPWHSVVWASVAVALLVSMALIALDIQIPADASLPSAPNRGAVGTTFQLSLVHTNDTWGYLAPCG
jgi:hypothetical protein